MYDGNGVMVNEEDGCGANDATRRVRYLSPGNRMTVRFTSDSSVTKAGFSCTVRAGRNRMLVYERYMNRPLMLPSYCTLRYLFRYLNRYG